MKTYGDRIRKFRNEKGFTQELMANRLDISQNAYWKIENEQTSIKMETLDKVAEILGINKKLLLNENESNNYNIEQTNYDNVTRVTISKENFEVERKVWQKLEASLLETIAAQKQTIELLQSKKGK